MNTRNTPRPFDVMPEDLGHGTIGETRWTRLRNQRSDRMHYGIRFIGTCILVGASLVLPIPVWSQSLSGSGGIGLSVGDVSQVIGGVVALGFGLWHFAVPGLYRWQSYVPDAPDSLVRAVDATNFFFSFSLSMIGVTNIVMPYITDAADPISRFWLWANVGLWTSRVVFQLVKPQGSHSPALQWGMTAAFTLTDVLMIVSALDATF
jgi:hypothetical protein